MSDVNDLRDIDERRFCGALVVSRAKHNQWHLDLKREAPGMDAPEKDNPAAATDDASVPSLH